MMLVVVGDRYAGAADLNVPYSWADEDWLYRSHGPRAHPENLISSFGYLTACLLHSGYHAGVCRDQTVDQIEDLYRQLRGNPVMILATWGLQHMNDWEKIVSFGKELEADGVDYCFINSQQTLDGWGLRWAWDPKEQCLEDWLQQHEDPVRAHRLLANLVMDRLTERWEGVILRK
jgi:hypothetical protein